MGRFRRSVFASALLMLCAPAVLAQPQEALPPQLQQIPSAPMPLAILQGLDKITARVTTFEAPIGQTIGFGTLRVTARTCRKRPPEYPPESAGYLEIIEERPGETPVQRFAGWMFASSPALNPLEHPVYDIWVVDCRAR